MTRIRSDFSHRDFLREESKYKLQVESEKRNRKFENESSIEQLKEEVRELREFKQMMENYLNSNREQL